MSAFIVRAPGRVNLIGEHIDYSGYSVLPMALEQDVWIHVMRYEQTATSPPWSLTLTNLDGAQYPPRTVHDALTLPAAHDWSSYVLAAFKGVAQHLHGDEVVPPKYSLSCTIRGSIPPGAGLSSSSALVCASAVVAHLAWLDHVDVDDLGRRVLADICCASERFIGTAGGGMDQAISFLAEQGVAKLIHFNPLTTESVRLPPGVTWCVAHSRVEAHKQRTAGRQYNKRVVECRVAAALLADVLGVGQECTTLKDVQEGSGKSLADMVELVDTALPETLEAVPEGMKGLPKVDLTEPLKIRARARHVYSEALRVLEFARAADDAERLGELMNASHESCAVDYECSCSELDTLRKACLDAGALGCRLTGAGWGGCVVAVVPDARVEAFKEAVVASHYADVAEDKRAALFFFTRPCAGVSITTARALD